MCFITHELMYSVLVTKTSSLSLFCYYTVATISKLLKIIGLFCKRALSKRKYSAKKTYDFEEPTTCSHPILLHLQYTSRVFLLRASSCRGCAGRWLGTVGRLRTEGRCAVCVALSVAGRCAVRVAVCVAVCAAVCVAVRVAVCG